MADSATNPVVQPDDGMAEFEAMLARVRAAQRMFSTYSQAQVEAIFKALGRALHQAVAINQETANEIPSTKGLL